MVFSSFCAYFLVIIKWPDIAGAPAVDFVEVCARGFFLAELPGCFFKVAVAFCEAKDSPAMVAGYVFATCCLLSRYMRKVNMFVLNESGCEGDMQTSGVVF